MSDKQVLLDCTFSWGKTCRLYHDSIEIAGKSYNLDDLTYIHPTYRTLFGVSSARLELCFGPQRLTLRGIPNPEIARQMVSHLLPYAEQASSDTLSHRVRSRSNQARDTARAQAKAWERTSKMPTVPRSPQNTMLADPSATPETEPDGVVKASASLSKPAHAFDDFLDFTEQPTSLIPASSLPAPRQPLSQTPAATSQPVSEQPGSAHLAGSAPAPEQPGSPRSADSLPASEQTSLPVDAPSVSEQTTSPISTDLLEVSKESISQASANAPTLPEQPSTQNQAEEPPASEQASTPILDDVPGPSEQAAQGSSTDATPPREETRKVLGVRRTARPAHIPRLQPPLRPVQLVQPEKKMLEACAVPVRALKASVLPIIHVPVRLQPGECAHYSIGAALCSDRIASSERAPYPPLDHGLLILTNRRIFYIGKRSQLVLAYTHLWYVSLLHNAIALHIEGQFRRIIMEIEHPEEWASRIDQLSSIVRRSQTHSGRSAAPFVLPGLKPSAVHPATLKRAALHAPAAPGPNLTSTTKPGVQIDQGIVEARTVELGSPAPQKTVEAATLELNPHRHMGDAATIELQPTNPPHITGATTDTFSTSHVQEAQTREFAAKTGPAVASGGLLSARAPQDCTETKTIALYSPVEEPTRALSSHAQKEDVTGQFVNCARNMVAEEVTRDLPPGEQAEKIPAESEVFSEEEVEAKTSMLPLHAQENPEGEDEQTMPLRRKQIAEISTLPLRPRLSQKPMEPDMRTRRASRTLSRPRFLKE